MSLSIIITYHNESQAFLEECIDQLRSSIHVPYEMIVVDDHSIVSLKPISGVTIIRKPYQSGVGNSFDLGVSHAKYSNLFLMACDTRYMDNGWSDLLLSEVELYPKSLICTGVVGLNTLSHCCESDIHKGMCLKCRQPAKDNTDLSYRSSIKTPQTGADILIFHDSTNDKNKPKAFRNIIEAKWLPTRLGKSFEIPCILGACYATTKEWYEYIDGFWGHRYWSGLEPYISLKSWLMGGSCRCVPSAETGHIWKQDIRKVNPFNKIASRNGYHNVPPEAIIYNKLLIATLLFDDSERLISFLGDGPVVEKAKGVLNSKMAEIENKRNLYKLKTVMTMKELINKLKLDYRENEGDQIITGESGVGGRR